MPPDPVWLDADEHQLRQIVVEPGHQRHSRRCPAAGGSRCSWPIEDGEALIGVRDQGTGIPPEEVDAIFHPFRGSFGRGTGLGLAIVHRIVTDYNGRIDVQSAVGRGTTIVVRFPAPKASGVRPAAPTGD